MVRIVAEPRVQLPVVLWRVVHAPALARHQPELRLRGAATNFTKKAEVVSFALSIARGIAGKPAIALRQVKRSFYESIREEFAAAIKRELQTHAIAFADPEIRERIKNSYQD